jgi:hypothetical protein
MAVFPADMTLKIRQAFTNPVRLEFKLSIARMVGLEVLWLGRLLVALTAFKFLPWMVFPNIEGRSGFFHETETTMPTVTKKYMA